MNLNGLIPLLHVCLFASVTPLVRDTQRTDPHETLQRMVFITNLTRASMYLLLFVVIFGVLFLILRMKKIRDKHQKDKITVSEITPEELKAIYGDDLPEGFASIDKMSREELRIVAEKELEKEGRKIGEIDYLKGPLDWDDVDENFKPRPKVVRSDLSRPVEKAKDEEDAESE